MGLAANETDGSNGGLRSGGESLGKSWEGWGEGLHVDDLSGVMSIMQPKDSKVNSHIRGEFFALAKTCMKLRKAA